LYYYYYYYYFATCSEVSQIQKGGSTLCCHKTVFIGAVLRRYRHAEYLRSKTGFSEKEKNFLNYEGSTAFLQNLAQLLSHIRLLRICCVFWSTVCEHALFSWPEYSHRPHRTCEPTKYVRCSAVKRDVHIAFRCTRCH